MLTADAIRTEISRAFDSGHGVTCDCCERFPGGRSPLEAALLSEARYAVDRFEPGFGLADDGPTDAELEELAEAAAVAALAAAHDAIVDRAIARLASSAPPTPAPSPVIVPLDPSAPRVDCWAETFDGVERRRCTRPAAVTRDGLEVCWQHGQLSRITLATERIAGDVA